VSDRSKIHHPYDQWFKALADACFELGAKITRERVVHVPAQRIDVAFEPRTRAPVLGVLDRLMALGPGMFEYFANPPSRADVRHCLRKRLVYEHERALDAQRDGLPTPPEPRLWILSAGRPNAALQACGAARMPDWPAGFWRAALDEHLYFVLLHELPEHPDTLLLRLAGRGTTFQRAFLELSRLPEEHALRARAWPVLVAHEPAIMQDLKGTAVMNLYEQALVVYNEYVQRIRSEEAQRVRQEEAVRLQHETQRVRQEEALRIRQEEAWRLQHLLIRLLTHRFGALPDDVLARIRHADTATLGRWAERQLTAQSLDDVFA
jgi:hypothetical protein